MAETQPGGVSVEAFLYAAAKRIDTLEAKLAEVEHLTTACFEAGHYPNPIAHSVTDCAICGALIDLAAAAKSDKGKDECICEDHSKLCLGGLKFALSVLLSAGQADKISGREGSDEPG